MTTSKIQLKRCTAARVKRRDHCRANHLNHYLQPPTNESPFDKIASSSQEPTPATPSTQAQKSTDDRACNAPWCLQFAPPPWALSSTRWSTTQAALTKQITSRYWPKPHDCIAPQSSQTIRQNTMRQPWLTRPPLDNRPYSWLP